MQYCCSIISGSRRRSTSRYTTPGAQGLKENPQCSKNPRVSRAVTVEIATPSASTRASRVRAWAPPRMPLISLKASSMELIRRVGRQIEQRATPPFDEGPNPVSLVIAPHSPRPRSPAPQGEHSAIRTSSPGSSRVSTRSLGTPRPPRALAKPYPRKRISAPRLRAQPWGRFFQRHLNPTPVLFGRPPAFRHADRAPASSSNRSKKGTSLNTMKTFALDLTIDPSQTLYRCTRRYLLRVRQHLYNSGLADR